MNKILNKEDERRKQISITLGKNILEMRKQKNYTREELAEKSNLSANYIYGLENGTYLPGCLALIDLSNALETTPSQLLDKYINNKKENLIEHLSNNLDYLSEKDLNLLSNIITYLSQNSSK